MGHSKRLLLGVNHMFLYPENLVNYDHHTDTLQKLADSELIDAIDCWVWENHSKAEIKILKDSGKIINYNIGDRIGDKPVCPSAKEVLDQQYAMEILKRETDYALEVGAKKIIFGSGKFDTASRSDAQKRFAEFVEKWLEFIPSDVNLLLEPTDWDIDKRFLYGPLEDTSLLVSQIHNDGFENFGILLDMGHIPIMHETIESAINKILAYTKHIHLGNCVLKKQDSALYGDKHPCWGVSDGEYNEDDGESLLSLLKENKYFDSVERTITFEMRPYSNMSSIETLRHLTEWFDRSCLKLNIQ